MVYLIWGFKPGTLDETGKMIESDTEQEALYKSGLDNPHVDFKLDMTFDEALKQLI